MKNVNVQRSHSFSLVIAMVVAVTAPALVGQNLNPRFKSREKAIQSFGVLPAKIEASGKNADDKDRTQELAEQLQELVSEALKKSGWQVAEEAFGDKALGQKAAQESITAAQTAYDGLSRNLRSRPKDISKGTFSLGEPVRKLSSIAAVDALVFIRAQAVLDSETKVFAEPGSFGFTIIPKNKVQSQFAIVDAKTGEALYFFEAQGRGDNLQTKNGLEKSISAAVAKLPRDVTAQIQANDDTLPTGVTKLVDQEDARRELAALDKDGRLIVPGQSQSMYSGGDLKKENCFGIILPNGARLLGESKGRDYGFTLRWPKATYSPFMPVIGLLYVDGAVQIEGKSTTPGPYFVITSGREFRLVRSLFFEDSVDLHEFVKGLDVFPGSKTRPQLTSKLEKGLAYLVVGGNKLLVGAL